MNRFDFLSIAPKSLIFEGASNKTNLGGVFTLIYLIIVLLISFINIYDYLVNDKYIVTYTHDYRHINNDNQDEAKKQIEKRYNDPNLNPKISFKFQLDGSYDLDRFYLIYLNKSIGDIEYMQFNTSYEKKIYDFLFILLYKCDNFTDDDKECKIREKDKLNKLYNMHTIYLNYTGYKLDHQNAESPLKKEYFIEEIYFSLKRETNFYLLKWKTIKYSEDRGIMKIFGNSNDIYGGEFKNHEALNADGDAVIKDYLKKGLLPLFILTVNHDEMNNEYDIYTRKKIEIIEPIANICSLSITIYNGFSLIFYKIYSINFDNYKIIDKILYKKYNKKFIKNKDNNSINENDFDDLENKENNEDEENEDNNHKELTLLNQKDTDNEIIVKKVAREDEENKNEAVLPKLRLYHYLFNNVYKRNCCCKIYNQEIISTCNDIVSKYFSIENIVYNQLLLENLFKDYRWNNPKLNNIENIKLVNELILLLNK